MNSPIIRQATINDLDKVAEVFDKYRIFYGCDSDLQGAKQFIYERFLNMQSIIFIALDEEENCIGFTQLYPSFSSVSMKKVYILNDLFVCEECRRKHIGSLLLKSAIAYGENFGVARITLTTDIANVNAQALYEKTGFAFDDENKVYHYFYKVHSIPQIEE